MNSIKLSPVNKNEYLEKQYMFIKTISSNFNTGFF